LCTTSPLWSTNVSIPPSFSSKSLLGFY
jgi:hypothetical protein